MTEKIVDALLSELSPTWKVSISHAAARYVDESSQTIVVDATAIAEGLKHVESIRACIAKDFHPPSGSSKAMATSDLSNSDLLILMLSTEGYGICHESLPCLEDSHISAMWHVIETSMIRMDNSFTAWCTRCIHHRSREGYRSFYQLAVYPEKAGLRRGPVMASLLATGEKGAGGKIQQFKATPLGQECFVDYHHFLESLSDSF